MNCSGPELHFSTRFFGSWPQKRRNASGPILVPRGRLSLWLNLFPDGKIEWPVPVPTPRAILSLVPPLPVHSQDKLQPERNRSLKVLILQGGRLLIKRPEMRTRAQGGEKWGAFLKPFPMTQCTIFWVSHARFQCRKMPLNLEIWDPWDGYHTVLL